jgi:WD40 repeat protein
LRHEGPVTSVAFSPNGQIVLTGAKDRTARLWSSATGRPIGPPLEHHGIVLAVAFRRDGRAVLTASEDYTARLWELPAPLRDQSERIKLWTQLHSGIEMGAQGAMRPLNVETWRARLQRLEQLGGPP